MAEVQFLVKWVTSHTVAYSYSGGWCEVVRSGANGAWCEVLHGAKWCKVVPRPLRPRRLVGRQKPAPRRAMPLALIRQSVHRAHPWCHGSVCRCFVCYGCVCLQLFFVGYLLVMRLSLADSFFEQSFSPSRSSEALLACVHKVMLFEVLYPFMQFVGKCPRLCVGACSWKHRRHPS